MWDKCGNCDCADKSQCVKKGSSYSADIVEAEKSTCTSTMVMMDAPDMENDGKCKCGASCTCTACTCDH